MKISLVILLGTVIGVLSIADGYQQRKQSSYSYYGFDHEKDPFRFQNHAQKFQWQEPMSNQAWSNNHWDNRMTNSQWQRQKPQWWYDHMPKSDWRKQMKPTRKPQAPYISKISKLAPIPNLDSIPWPDYIPPIRMIKLPLDEPPAA